MKIEIINIGDELLIGQVLNTNSFWMSKELDKSGFEVVKVSIIPDDKEEIKSNVLRALSETDCVLITGGLGPTKDDITKLSLAEIFNMELVESPEVLKNIKRIFSLRGFALTQTNRNQALVPDGSKIISNPLGTAPGMCFESEGKLIISMPGVPFEMEAMMKNDIMPLLISHYKPIGIFHRTILVQGIGESFLSDLIDDFEDSLPKHIKIAYLPSSNLLRLRLSAKGEDIKLMERQIDEYVGKLLPIIKDYFIGFGQEDLSLVLANILNETKSTLSIAESCTGGYLAHQITKNPGASDYFSGSITAYSNKIKQEILGVNENNLINDGAVSKIVAEEMAINTLKLFDTDYSISTTGIAGPSGGSKKKPLGMVWISVADKNLNVVSKEFCFNTSRQNFIERTTNQALSMLIRLILKDMS